MTIFEEQKGVHSMRRFLAFLSFANGAALSWKDTAWQIIGLWILAGLVLLGLTTVQEIQSLRFPDVGETMEQFGNPERLEQ